MKLPLALLTGVLLVSQPNHAAAQGGVAANHDQMEICCQKIVRDIQRIYYLSNRNGKMRLVVRGIYAHGKTLFFSLKLVNRSALDYDINSIRFYVAQKQKGIRIPRRLEELRPLFVYDSAQQVPGHDRLTCVVAIPRRALPRHCRLQIEVMERNGARPLLVQAAGFTLQTARSI